MNNVSFELPDGNGRDLRIGKIWEWEMGMGIKSLKWEGIGTKKSIPAHL